MKTVAEHMAVALPKRDLDWIKSSLQTAIMLEHATMPPYIAATYSLKVQNFTAYNLIRSIAMEEMVHMAAACNILAAIGGTPQIKNLNPVYPSYGLPGGAEPDLFVCLAPLSVEQLNNFMRLEAPKTLVDPRFVGEDIPSISTFYAALRQAIQDNSGDVCAAVKAGGKANQVGDNIGFSTIVYSDKCLDDILQAIDSIMAQGEGLIDCSLYADGSSELEESHYVRFAQIRFGRQLSVPPDQSPPTFDTIEKFFNGHPIPFPVVTNTLAVPADGYDRLLAEDADRAAVEKDLTSFDQAYSDVMAGLDACWNGDPAKWWPTMGAAVALMAKLRVLGCFNVMKHQVPDAAIQKLRTLYPDEFQMFSTYTRLDEPVFYGPRFRNLNAAPPQKS
jgi:ferritin-like protein